MKKFIAPWAFTTACMMAVLALLVFGRAASASDAVGWIILLDEESDQIVLDSGRTFSLSDEIDFSSLADGKRVRVTYETIGGIPTVTGIVALAPERNQAESPSLEAPAPVCIKIPPQVENRTHLRQARLYC